MILRTKQGWLGDWKKPGLEASLRKKHTLRIAVRRVQVRMTHPATDHGHVNPGSHQSNRGRMPKHMRGDPLCGQ
jgi:hypothetical protein